MNDLYREYEGKVEFFLVYIKEAHPADGRQSGANKRDGVIYNEPRTLQERASIAGDCIKNLNIAFPCLLDSMDNKFQKTYRGSPSRAIVVDKEGKVFYASKPGPRGVEPDKIREAVKKLF